MHKKNPNRASVVSAWYLKELPSRKHPENAHLLDNTGAE